MHHPLPLSALLMYGFILWNNLSVAPRSLQCRLIIYRTGKTLRLCVRTCEPALSTHPHIHLESLGWKMKSTLFSDTAESPSARSWTKLTSWHENTPANDASPCVSHLWASWTQSKRSRSLFLVRITDILNKEDSGIRSKGPHKTLRDWVRLCWAVCLLQPRLMIHRNLDRSGTSFAHVGAWLKNNKVDLPYWIMNQILFSKIITENGDLQTSLTYFL